MDTDRQNYSGKGAKTQGKMNIFDDGIIRYRVPDEWSFGGRENEESSQVTFFRHQSLGLSLVARRLFATAENGEFVGVHAGDILAARTMAPGEVRYSLLQLATGLWMLSSSVPQDSNSLSCCELGLLINQETLHVIQFWLDVSEATEPHSLQTSLAIHALKRDIRLTMCSLGEPRFDSSPESRIIPQINVVFPENLGGLKFVFAQDFESTGPGEGISLRYSDGEGVKADLYVYSLGLDYLENGIESRDIQGHFAQVENEIVQAPIYSGAEQIRRDILVGQGRGGDVPFLHGVFRLQQTAATPDALWVVSHLALTAFKGHFVKIRFTYSEATPSRGDTALQQFIEEIATLLTR